MDRDQKERLDQDEKELEELVFGTKEEVKDDEGSAETTDSGVTKATAEDTTTETEATVAKPPVEEKALERNWETEYKSLRTNSDNYKFTTRQELASLKERLIAADVEIDKLRSSVVVPKEDPFKDTFSQEDADTVGEDALLLMKKAATIAADAKTKSIQEELDRERKLRLDAQKRGIQEDKTQATNIFLRKLEEVVPNYKEINYDPAFEKYMKAEDPLNGGQRLLHFKNAERSGNISVVAQYMGDFLGTKKEPVDSLAERVTPTGSPVANDTGVDKVKLIPISEVDKFYADVGKGKYKGNKTLEGELEAKYDLAFSKRAIDYTR